MDRDHTVSDSPICFILEPIPSDFRWETDPLSWHNEAENSEQNGVSGSETPTKISDFWRHRNARKPSTAILNTYYNELIEPTLGAHEFGKVRSTGITHKGMVTQQHQLLAESSALMIANISSYDPVVFYCVAHRLAKVAKGDRSKSTLFLRHADSVHLFEVSDLETIEFGLPRRYEATNFDESRESMAVQRLQEARRDLTRQVARFFETRQAHLRAMASPPAPFSSPRPENQKPDQTAKVTRDRADLPPELEDLAKSFTDKIREDLRRDMTSVVRNVARRYYYSEKL